MSSSPVISHYIPLYRKYRPQQFSDLVGQEMVSTAIGNALTLNRIAHAYLFCGPRGTGKTSSARILAKSLNCVNGPTPSPCQVCPSCVSITNGTALDVTEIDAASNNGVENIRDLTDKVQFAAIQGKFKVYIIDEVHMLSTAAFNALLKTLEEPPPNVIFIFATTEPHKVLPTIISRCQRFDFSRITRPQIEGRLAEIAQLESIKIEQDALTLISRHVRGGMRDALGLLDQVSVLGQATPDKAVTAEDVRSFVGLLEEDVLLEMMAVIQKKDPQGVLSQIRYLQERGIEPGQMTRELMAHCRNLLLALTCGPKGNADLLEITPDAYEKLYAQAQGFAPEELPQMLNRLSHLETQLRHTQQPLLWLEIALLDLCYRVEIHAFQTLVDKVAALEARLQNGAPIPASTVASAPATRPAPSPTQSAPIIVPIPSPVAATVSPNPPAQSSPTSSVPMSGNSANLASIRDAWPAIINAISHMPTRSLVKDHFLLQSADEATITIVYSGEMIFDIFKRTPEKLNYLQQAVQAVLGKPYRLQFQLAGASSSPVKSPAPAPVSPPAMPPTPSVEQPVAQAVAQKSTEPLPVEKTAAPPPVEAVQDVSTLPPQADDLPDLPEPPPEFYSKLPDEDDDRNRDEDDEDEDDGFITPTLSLASPGIEAVVEGNAVSLAQSGQALGRHDESDEKNGIDTVLSTAIAAEVDGDNMVSQPMLALDPELLSEVEQAKKHAEALLYAKQLDS